VVRLRIDGEEVSFPAGNTVLVAILAHRGPVVRRSVSGEPRGPLCGMGVCYECRVTIDGVEQVKSCQTLVRDGMEIQLGD
jgi:D-hydroxyproline dehydrogenase subunit gamma